MDLEVLWMDGEHRIYKNVTTSVREGVLHLHEYNDRRMITSEWHFPTFNIRAYWPADNMTALPESNHGT